MTRYRLEVEAAAGDGFIVSVDLPDHIDPRHEELIAALVDDLAEFCLDPVGALLVEVTERLALHRAYHREAERRGVLAL